MHLAKIAERLTAEEGTGLAVGAVQTSELTDAGFDVISTHNCDLAGRVFAHLVRAPKPFPATIPTADGRQLVRWMDRFYLPDPGEPAVTEIFFNVIATVYDEVNTPETNVAVAVELIRPILEVSPPAASILDFGSGSGLSVVALKRIERCGTCEVIGVDSSIEMRRVAARRGLATVPPEALEAMPAAFDGAVATFVLHFRPAERDLLRIARCLRPGARFAANLLKGSAQEIENLERLLRGGELTLERVWEITAAGVPHPALLFRKCGS